ncbi:MAG TPA: efflux RND transporter periplasmic adaptor subunit [Candidatus Limnocylindrales bacterium]|nr:efflux RND transporter periplasmic adaptor subunit [Candidatus Limnocylindrales bacterium]
MRYRGNILRLLSIDLLLIAAMSACSRPAPPPPPAPKVTIAQPIAREVTEWDDYTARLEATDSVEVRARVSGYLQAVLFHDGAIVKKGDLLMLIDPRPYEATLRSAEADLALAKSRLDIAAKNRARANELIRSHAISQEDADIRESNLHQAEANVEQAEAAVDAAKLDVEFTEITAPIGGRIGRRLVTQGNLISGGNGAQSTLLATIVSLDPIYAYFDADERAYLKYTHLAQTGERPSSREHRNPVWVGIGDEEGFPREGSMDFVDNQLDPSTGTMVARAELPNPDLRLAPGLFARLRLIGSGKFQAVQIPDEAIVSDQSQKFVWVVDNENRAQYRKIQAGVLIDGLRVVRDGLSTDDWVITSGIQRVKSGQPVDPERQKIEPAPSPAAAAAPPAQPQSAGR